MKHQTIQQILMGKSWLGSPKVVIRPCTTRNNFDHFNHPSYIRLRALILYTSRIKNTQSRVPNEWQKLYPPEHDQRHREPVDEQHRGVRGEGTGDVRGEARPPHGRTRSSIGFRACGYLRNSADDGVHVQGEIILLDLLYLILWLSLIMSEYAHYSDNRWQPDIATNHLLWQFLRATMYWSKSTWKVRIVTLMTYPNSHNIRLSLYYLPMVKFISFWDQLELPQSEICQNNHQTSCNVANWVNI